MTFRNCLLLPLVVDSYIFSINMAPFVILSNFGLCLHWKIRTSQKNKTQVTKICLRRIPAPKLGDFETLLHAFFSSYFGPRFENHSNSVTVAS